MTGLEDGIWDVTGQEGGGQVDGELWEGLCMGQLD